jgi:hypothetical protein
MGHKKIPTNVEILHVGMTRFELATPRPPDVCATGLRYIPKFCISSEVCPAIGGTTSRNFVSLQKCVSPLAGLHPEIYRMAKVIENFNFKNFKLSYLYATFIHEGFN